MNFNTLPSDMIAQICYNLDTQSIGRLASTCKNQAVATQYNSIWHRMSVQSILSIPKVCPNWKQYFKDHMVIKFQIDGTQAVPWYKFPVEINLIHNTVTVTTYPGIEDERYLTIPYFSNIVKRIKGSFTLLFTKGSNKHYFFRDCKEQIFRKYYHGKLDKPETGYYSMFANHEIQCGNPEFLTPFNDCQSKKDTRNFTYLTKTINSPITQAA